MSTRSSIRPTKIITNGDMSASITSSPTLLNLNTLVCYQAKWTGTSPVGTLSLQGSSDYALNPNGTVANSGTWTTLTLVVNGSPSSTVAVSGNSGNALIDVGLTGINAVRLVYTFTSGVGTLNATVNGKVS